MSAQFYRIHPENPQQRLVEKAVEIIRRGGVIVYPTDSAYALGCQVGNKKALDKIRAIRGLEEAHHFTLVCRDLSELSTYARVSDGAYRILRALTPGPYTFILKATKEVPRKLQHPQRKSVGLRVPDHPIVRELLYTLDAPIMSTTLILPGSEVPIIQPDAIRDVLGRQVDLVIDGGDCGTEGTTIVDLSGDTPEVIREGKGKITPFLL